MILKNENFIKRYKFKRKKINDFKDILYVSNLILNLKEKYIISSIYFDYFELFSSFPNPKTTREEKQSKRKVILLHVPSSRSHDELGTNLRGLIKLVRGGEISNFWVH